MHLAIKWLASIHEVSRPLQSLRREAPSTRLLGEDGRLRHRKLDVGDATIGVQLCEPLKLVS